MGAMDMSGNVWEWVSSLYLSFPYDASKAEDFSENVKSRTVRGGSFNRNEDNVRADHRQGYYPDVREDSLGFRCARTSEGE